MRQPAATPREDPRGGGAARRGAPGRRRAGHPGAREARRGGGRDGTAASAQVADALRGALISGDFAALGDLYADDALLDASLPGERHRVAGARTSARAARLAVPRPGAPRRVVAAAASRWHRALVRARLRRRRGGAPAPLSAAPRRSHRAPLGLQRARRARSAEAAARRPARHAAGRRSSARSSSTSRWSRGAGRGTCSSASCSPTAGVWSPSGSCPGTNWIDRHTKDEGREALLFSSGVLEPAARRRSTTRSSPRSATATPGGW